MPSRERSVDRASARARAIVADLGRELHQARLDRAVSLGTLSQATHLSRSQISRIERGLTPNLGIPRIARLLAAVGLDLSARAYPAGEPIRDAAHARLLGSLRARLPPSVIWRTEVPLQIQGDLRAWDAVIVGRGWRVGVECERRPRDLQALERRLALKERDGGLDCLVLLLLDSAHNRRLVAGASGLLNRFPIPGPRALALLGEGKPPGGNAVVRL
jgi:transcriptional regulator with XRE-family HTH domain